MPGPIAIAGDRVECRLCDFTAPDMPDDDTADEVAHQHIVSAHPEVEEP